MKIGLAAWLSVCGVVTAVAGAAPTDNVEAIAIEALTRTFVAIEDGDWVSIRENPDMEFHAVQLHKPAVKLRSLELTKADQLNGLTWKGFVEINCEAYREVDIDAASSPARNADGSPRVPWQRWKDWSPQFAECYFYREKGEWKIPNFAIGHRPYVRPKKPIQNELADFISAHKSKPEDNPPVELAASNQPAIDPQQPRRQSAKQQHMRPAIRAENKFGTSNIGNIAVDAKWSNYGVYLQKIIETVQSEWDKILSDARNYPGSGTYVSVKFILNPEGRIARIVEVDNHSTDQGSRSCVSAITNRAPYGPWTEEMKAVLGEQQEMTFTFYYQ